MRLNKAQSNMNERLTIEDNLVLAGLIATMDVQRGEECRLATINSNGLGDIDKKDAVALFLTKFAIDICVISETHLRLEEMNNLKKHFLDYGYKVGASVCRKPGVGKKRGRARGGVVILVRHEVSTVELTEIPLPKAPIDACSLLVLPSSKMEECFRITGAYCPPPPTSSRGKTVEREEEEEAFRPSKEKIEMTFQHKTNKVGGDAVCGHLVVGDLNPVAWADGFQGWMAESGAWELTDPSRRTHREGGALDKVIFQPWGEVPDCFLRAEGGAEIDYEWSLRQEGDYYPAITVPVRVVSDHHPVILRLPFQGSKLEPPRVKPLRKLKIENLSDEDWRNRNGILGAMLLEKKNLFSNFERDGNPTRIWESMVSLINKVFQNDFSRSKPGKDIYNTPHKRLCKLLTGHNCLPDLILAYEQGDVEAYSKLRSKLVRENWKGYLAERRSTDTSAMFAYLAKAEGRKGKLTRYACAAPLKDEKGNLVVDDQQKVDLLSRHYENKFSAPAELRKGGHGKQSARRTQSRPIHISVWGTFEKFKEVEVLKALDGLARGKAPGPDLLPVELFQRLPCLLGPLTQLFNCIVESGRFPQKMAKVFIVPLDKPNKDATLCGSKRPISLICVAAKLLEATVLQRLLPNLEGTIDPDQYAYQRDKGTEFHLLRVYDFICREIQKGRFVYLAAVDIDGAFDNVPHAGLIASLLNTGADCVLCRYVAKWLQCREFRVRLRSVKGAFLSPWRPLSKVLPQGGVLSPFLWLLHLNLIQERIDCHLREMGGPLPGLNRMSLFYADDEVILLSHEDPHVLVRAAIMEAGADAQALSDLHLSSNAGKSQSMVFSPGNFVGGPFRRTEEGGAREILKSSERLAGIRGEMESIGINGTREWFGAVLEGIFLHLPYKVADSVKVLGVTFDCCLDFQGQLRAVLDKARVRLALLTRIAGTSWGVETNTLRQTYDALLTSTIRYGLVLMGSGLFEDHLSRIETRLTNIAARRVVGVGGSARLMVLHIAAGVQSARNLYILNCAFMMDRAVRTHNSSISASLRSRLAQRFNVPNWKMKKTAITDIPGLRLRMGLKGIVETLINEEWYAELLDYAPGVPTRCSATSIFHTNAKELRTVPGFCSRTYSFKDTDSWFDVGMQVLHLIGWRGDSAQPEEINIMKCLPPGNAKGFLVVENAARMRWSPAGGGEIGSQNKSKIGTGNIMPKDKNMQRNENLQVQTLVVAVGNFFQQHVGATCSYMRDPGGNVTTQGWIRGEAVPDTPIPACIEIMGLCHALELVYDFLIAAPAESLAEIVIYASDKDLLRTILDWFNTGRLSAYTSGVSEVVRLFHKLDKVLYCPMTLKELPKEFFLDCVPDGIGIGDVLINTANRLFLWVVPAVRAAAKGRLVRLPLTKKEVKKRILDKFHKDETAAIQMLSSQGSEACRIMIKLHLDRPTIRLTHAELSENRPAQVTLSSVICATRFKYVDNVKTKVLHPTLCQVCRRNRIDNFEHLTECVGLREIPAVQDFVVDYLVMLAKRAITPNPGIPIKYIADSELCLVDYSDSSLEEISF